LWLDVSDGAHDVQHQPVGVNHEEMALAVLLVADLGGDLSAESLRPLVGLVDVVDVNGQNDTYVPGGAVRPANRS
jgi:hypothetical protein